MSAEKDQGTDLLFKALAQLFSSTKVRRRCYLQPSQGGVRARLFDYAKIIDEKVDEFGGWDLVVEIDKKHLGLLKMIKTEDVE
jgi:GTP-binding protein HflX